MRKKKTREEKHNRMQVNMTDLLDFLKPKMNARNMIREINMVFNKFVSM